MAVESITATAGTPPAPAVDALRPGSVLAARVAALLDGGMVRLATAAGPMDVATDVPLQTGQALRLQVQTWAAGLLLSLVGENAHTTETPDAPPAPTLAGPAQADALLHAVASALGRGAASTAATSALFANLGAVLRGEAGLPSAEATGAAMTVAAHALDADVPVMAEQLRTAVARSGLFREARLAGMKTPAATAGDLKSALMTLRAVLSGLVEAIPEPPGPAPQVATVPLPPPADPARAPLAGDAPASAPDQVPEAPGSLPDVGPVVRDSWEPDRPGVQGRPEAGLDAPPSAPTRATTATALLLRALVAGEQPGTASPASASQEAALRYAGPGGRTDARHGEAPPMQPPRADVPPRPEPGSEPTLPLGAGPATTARLLLDETDRALDRTLLTQYASLPREPAGREAGSPQLPQAWLVDVPILMGREATAAQMRITREGAGHSGAPSGDGPRWAIDLALESSVLGPVQARIRLARGGVAVTLWAERPDTAERFSARSSELRSALESVSLPVEDLSVRKGAPPAPRAAGGYFVDRQS